MVEHSSIYKNLNDWISSIHIMNYNKQYDRIKQIVDSILQNERIPYIRGVLIRNLKIIIIINSMSEKNNIKKYIIPFFRDVNLNINDHLIFET